MLMIGLHRSLTGSLIKVQETNMGRTKDKFVSKY